MKLANRDIVHCAIESCAERAQQPSPVGEGYTLFSPRAGGSNALAEDPWVGNVVEARGGGRDTSNPLHLLSRASLGGGAGSGAAQRVVAALPPSSAAKTPAEYVAPRFSDTPVPLAAAVVPPPPSSVASAHVELVDADTEVLVEMRVDADGHAYTKARFVEHYGGESEWDAAATAEEHVGAYNAQVPEDEWHDDWEEAF